MAPLLELDPAFTTIIAGLETLRGPRELTKIVQMAGVDRIVFSLDLFEKRPTDDRGEGLGNRGFFGAGSVGD